MSRDDIIKLAQKWGDWNGQTVEFNDVGLERFAALVAAAEREACARECWLIQQHYGHNNDEDDFEYGLMSAGAERCVAAIRARSQA